jgi:hypothetical protein
MKFLSSGIPPSYCSEFLAVIKNVMNSKGFGNTEKVAKGLITLLMDVTSLVFTSDQKYFTEYIM